MNGCSPILAAIGEVTLACGALFSVVAILAGIVQGAMAFTNWVTGRG